LDRRGLRTPLTLHPQTQGKIERWHQTLKNRILLENYFLPGDLEARIEAFVEHYNHQRYHESLSNVSNGAQTGPRIGVEEGPPFEIERRGVEDALGWVRRRSGVARPEAHPAQVRSQDGMGVAANCGF